MEVTKPHQPVTNYSGVQSLRFVAAFLVLLTHATFYTAERLTPGSGFWPDGATGVNIFFVISGFVMVVSSTELARASDGWKTFSWRRLIRIVPMYWMATTLKLMVLILVPSVVLHSQFDVWHILSSYFFIPTTNVEGEFKPLLAVGWTLYFEMFFYLLFALALYLRVNVYYFVGAILIVFASLSMFRVAGMPAATMFFDPLVLQFFFGMLVAATVGRGGALTRLTIRHPLILAGLVACGMVLLLTPFAIPGVAEAFKTGIPATMIVLGVVWLEPQLSGRIPRTLLVLGDASYVLYLFHPLMVPVIPTALNQLGIINGAVSILLSIIIAIVGSVLIYFMFDLPLRRLLRPLAVPRRVVPISA